MKQLTQNFKTGDLKVDSFPVPALKDNFVLVENRFSLISVGTEKETISTGKASLLGKAKKRPDLVNQVLSNLKKEGLLSTYKKVQKKLDIPKALGYSSAGTIRVSLDSKGEFKPGDRVACAGQDYASHAEFISVPQNLVVKIPENVSFEEASFCTIGSIALQGIRQAESKIGENICVIGLGLIGQLTCQLLDANGCNVFGIDLNQEMVDMAQNISGIVSANREDKNLDSLIRTFTNGKLFDKVIITASTNTNDPIILSSEILRKKGIITVVGDVNLNIPRNPHFYQKELELKMSCSYGPGRYDVNYEEYGIDYPYEYVRWTEQRNMESFLNIISTGKLNVKSLISHVFEIDQAIDAYNLILDKNKNHFLGILIKYPGTEKETKSTIELKSKSLGPEKSINVGFIGAGSFAQSYLLPYVKSNAALIKVVTRSGISSKNVANKFNFQNSSTSIKELLNDKIINTVFIVTRHDSHASNILRAIKADKHIFVEKPLALNYDELYEIKSVVQNYQRILMVGYNRRFSPLSAKIKNAIGINSPPLVINYNINAGFIPKEHWTQTHEGGGRIVGELCHFIDLMQYFTDSVPINVFARCISTDDLSQIAHDNISINLSFRDGSVGNITYNANGNKNIPKEYISISCNGNSYEILDFNKAIIYKGNAVKKSMGTGKGHQEEVEAFLNAINLGLGPPIEINSLFNTSLASFKVLDSLSTGLPQEIIA